MQTFCSCSYTPNYSALSIWLFGSLVLSSISTLWSPPREVGYRCCHVISAAPESQFWPFMFDMFRVLAPQATITLLPVGPICACFPWVADLKLSIVLTLHSADFCAAAGFCCSSSPAFSKRASSGPPFCRLKGTCYGLNCVPPPPPNSHFGA